jgi:hypothetical protein
VTIASPTSSPGPNQTVSIHATGLTTGLTYNVAVTALDTAGNESACSAVASAIAQLDFSVSPTTSVNFGNVNVGSVADRTFTVQNLRSGTVTGTASVSAPFSIVSGSPFTLAGAGATQTVTVRFTPTTGALASTNVTFSADGDALSRLVTGTGVSAVLTLSVNQTSFHRNDTLRLTATVTSVVKPFMADAYVAIQLPSGSLLYLKADGTFTQQAQPIVRNWLVSSFSGQIFSYSFSGGEPMGSYAWLGAFMTPGASNLVGPITSTPFAFSP